MNVKFIALGTALLLLSLSTGFAACTSVRFSEDPITLNKTGAVQVFIENDCTKKESYNVTSLSPVASSLNLQEFSLYPNEVEILALEFFPINIEEGDYQVTVRVEGNETVSATAGIRVVENGFVGWVLPKGLVFEESGSTRIPFAIKNPSTAPITGLVVELKEGNILAARSDPFSLQPGEELLKRVAIKSIPPGAHTFKIRATAGKRASTRYIDVNVTAAELPLDTVISVEQFKPDALKIKYDVRNNAQVTYKELFLTIDNAPEAWEVISPSAFDLAPKERKQVSLVVYHDGLADFTVALYKGGALMAGDTLTVSDISPVTGLITLGDPTDAILFLAVVACFLFLRREWKKAKRKKIVYPVKEFI